MSSSDKPHFARPPFLSACYTRHEHSKSSSSCSSSSSSDSSDNAWTNKKYDHGSSSSSSCYSGYKKADSSESKKTSSLSSSTDTSSDGHSGKPFPAPKPGCSDSSNHCPPSPPGPPKKPPNFLFIMVDEMRFPPPYETTEIKAWRETFLKAQNFLRDNGVEFLHHYAGSTACSPSRATLFTGEYPSLHGVSQTSGVAKSAFDPDIFWLDENTVPTMGDYFEEHGYSTFYKGKWHVSEANILIPATHNPYPSYNTNDGVPEPGATQHYHEADKLSTYGFHGWIGPEPHGSDPRNSGSSAASGVSGRDVIFRDEVVTVLEELDRLNKKAKSCPKSQQQVKPWTVVASFVNPHDITLLGDVSIALPYFNFHVDPSVPSVPPAPTANENLSTKPKAQESYKTTFQKAFQPTTDTEFYRKFYYSLQLQVDREIQKVLDTFLNSSLVEDTVVVFTSDHGDLLGSHGGLFQKWHCAYEEAIHVPLYFYNPRWFPAGKKVEAITSHVDILPTLFSLAGMNVSEVQGRLRRSHIEVRPLVGNDLSIFLGRDVITDLPESFQQTVNGPIYFMTDDEPTKGENQVTIFGRPYEPVIQPNHIQSVIMRIEGDIYKYSKYFENPQFDSSSDDECEDSSTNEEDDNQKALPEFEMYNVTQDPYEQNNLATFPPSEKQILLDYVLEQECAQKRLTPISGPVPNLYTCSGTSRKIPRIA